MTTRLAVLGVVLLAAACGGGDSDQARDRDTLTQRQRDSILAQSKIPGASGVGKAMRVADSVSARVRATDSVTP
ncbi:MAG TPA: hypothetical protein VGA20_11090 [Gemmatimonadales bacterium]